MKKLTKILFLVLLLSAIRYPLNATYAAVPHLINYQGRLTDSNGAPLNGSYSLTFRIYDAEAAGNLLWEEIQTGVVIQKGIFSILLGSVTNLDLPFDKPYFLEIKVGTEVMSPRQRITSAGYAIRAEKSEDANTVANVGVSTAPVANKILPLDSNAKIPQSALGLKVYDSGWFPVTNNSTYQKTHNLGTTKCLITILVSDSSDGNGITTLMPTWWWDPNNTNFFSIITKLTITQITLRTHNAGVAQLFDENGNGIQLRNGYARIIMLALE